MSAAKILAEKSKTPAQLGYQMPAEWTRHEATWLAWPQNKETWPGPRLEAVRGIYTQMIEALLPGEKVHLLVQDAKEQEELARHFKKRGTLSSNLIFHPLPHTDAWIRDYGPTFLVGPKGKAWCKWIFNAWGGKYESLARDTEVFRKLTSQIPVPQFDIRIVLEGGSIEVNGAGTCMTTEQCLLNKNRNPQLRRTEIEEILKAHLGVSHVLWLHEGIVGDDTDGHIDDIARFVNSNTILAAYEEDAHDENHTILKENWERLERASDEKGKKWNLAKLPMPGKVADDGVRLPASYANFYIANDCVLLPIYEHRNDPEAVAILADHFPGRSIISIPCRALVYGLGAIHCVTQQEPAAV